MSAQDLQRATFRSVIGFEGAIPVSRTPAWVAPVVAENPSVVRRPSTSDVFTAIEPIYFRPDHAFLVVGKTDMALLRAQRDLPAAAALLREADTDPDRRERFRTIDGGSLGAWYCTSAEAIELRRVLVLGFRQRMIASLKQDESEQAYDFAFRLQRAAVDATDALFAAAGIAQAGYPARADALISALRQPGEPISEPKELRAAREQLTSALSSVVYSSKMADAGRKLRQAETLSCLQTGGQP